MTAGQLELSSGLPTITGPAAGVTISGGGASRVFQIDSGVMATLSGLTITGGSASYLSGGGVINFGGVTLRDSTISGNTAGSGGGLANYGTAYLTGCTISGNSTEAQGGGLGNFARDGVANLTLTDCTISGNTADAGGGICNGPYLSNVAAVELTLTGCTIADNTARFGGGLLNIDTASLTDCTISGNSAQGYAGGGMLNLNGTATLTSCTLSGNTIRYMASGYGGGAGFYNYSGLYSATTATLTDTIVAGNSLSGSASDIAGPGASSVTGSYNLIGTGGSGGLTTADNNLIDVADPLLAPLGDYGGPTETIALLPGSPAIGVGTVVGGITTDQRGMPLDPFGSDIGAFQSNPLVVNTTVDGSEAPFGDLSLPRPSTWRMSWARPSRSHSTRRSLL